MYPEYFDTSSKWNKNYTLNRNYLTLCIEEPISSNGLDFTLLPIRFKKSLKFQTYIVSINKINGFNIWIANEKKEKISDFLSLFDSLKLCLCAIRKKIPLKIWQ